MQNNIIKIYQNPDSQTEMEPAGRADIQLMDGIMQIRKCSFKPEEHFINLEIDGEKKPRLYLPVEWRLCWLHTWCQENDKTYFVEENQVIQLPGTSYIQTECTVYIDGTAAGKGIGGINLNGPRANDYAVQSCATIAKGRALANAGFGSVFTSASPNESGGIEVPCDSGMSADFFMFKPLGPMFGNPMAPQNGIPASVSANQMPIPQSTVLAPAPAPVSAENTFTDQTPLNTQRKATQIEKTDACPTTREEALKFIVPLRGEWKGHALSEVVAKAPSTVRWYAENSRNADLKHAARLVLDIK